MMRKAMSGPIQREWQLHCEKIEKWNYWKKRENESVLLFIVFECTTKLLLCIIIVQNARNNFNNQTYFIFNNLIVLSETIAIPGILDS